MTARPTSRCRWCCSSTAVRGAATTGATAPCHQWLANRGYAVLWVNYRGSTGFGKKFINAGNLRVGRQDARRPDRRGRLGGRATASTSSDKVAIMGGSYGGYATLVGLTFTPDVFACGVDIVGPSNLFTLLADDPALLGAVQPAVLQAHRRPDDRGRQALLKAALAADLRRPDPAAAADRPGRQRSARQAGRSRPDRRGDEGEEHPGDLRAVPRRRPRLRPAGEQHRLQRGRREFPARPASAAAPSRSATRSRARPSRC